MKNFNLIVLIIVFLSPTLLLSQTEVEGEVSGDWSTENSPYIVTAEIFIPNNETLHIDAGVEVVFTDYFPFTIWGKIEAEGTIEDSIRFGSVVDTVDWGGLRFYTPDSGSYLEYCVIDGGSAFARGNEPDSVGSGGNVFVYSGDLMIQNCRISNGFAQRYGGGIAVWRANTIIKNSKIVGNYSQRDGGGIVVVYESNPVFEECNISENESFGSGGALLTAIDTEAIFYNCVFRSNASREMGGAALIGFASSPVFQKCQFLNNSSAVGGALNIRNENVNPKIEWCYFYANVASTEPRLGGAIYVRDYAEPEIKYSIFESNVADYGGAIYYKEEPLGYIHNNLFIRNGSTRGGTIETSENSGDVPLKLSNCTFIANRNTGLNPVANTAFARRNSVINLSSCIIWSEEPHFSGDGDINVDYTTIKYGWEGEGNSSQNPDFFELDSTWFLLSGSSHCIDSGNEQLGLDPDSTNNDRGWFYFPQDFIRGATTDTLSATPTAEETIPVSFTYRNVSGVPMYVTPADMFINSEFENTINLSDLLEDSSIHGAAFANDRYYISGGNNDDDPNTIYELDENFELIDTFDQPGGSSDQGFKDLGSPGNRILYGSYENRIVEFTTSGEFGDRYSGPGGIGNYAALGVDFNNPHGFGDFYVGGSEGIILRLDTEFWERQRIDVGTNVRSLAVKWNEREIYFMTDKVEFSELRRINFEDSSSLVIMEFSNDSTVMGGMEITEDLSDGRGTLMGVMEGTGNVGDYLFTRDMYINWLNVPHEWKLVMPGDSITWNVVFDGTYQSEGFYMDEFALMINGTKRAERLFAKMNSLGVRESDDEHIPLSNRIISAYPNPFNSELIVKYSVEVVGVVQIELIDNSGRLIAILENGLCDQGIHTTNLTGTELNSGVYFLRMKSATGQSVSPVVLTK